MRLARKRSVGRDGLVLLGDCVPGRLGMPCGGAGATAEDCRRGRLLHGIQDLGLVMRAAVRKYSGRRLLDRRNPSWRFECRPAPALSRTLTRAPRNPLPHRERALPRRPTRDSWIIAYVADDRTAPRVRDQYGRSVLLGENAAGLRDGVGEPRSAGSAPRSRAARCLQSAITAAQLEPSPTLRVRGRHCAR